MAWWTRSGWRKRAGWWTRGEAKAAMRHGRSNRKRAEFWEAYRSWMDDDCPDEVEKPDEQEMP